MTEPLYALVVNGRTAAKDLSIEDAALFAKALFERYRSDRNMIVSIKRMDRIAYDNDDLPPVNDL